MAKFQTPTGELAARIHGASREMRERAASARILAASRTLSPEHAASLRGKAKGYDEAADLLGALDRGRRIPKRRRWTGWKPKGLIGPKLATAGDVIAGRARYADTPGGHADRKTLAMGAASDPDAAGGEGA